MNERDWTGLKWKESLGLGAELSCLSKLSPTLWCRVWEASPSYLRHSLDYDVSRHLPCLLRSAFSKLRFLFYLMRLRPS